MEPAWRNAECVTSLYDRLRDLELRNAELEAEVLQWRETSKAARTSDATASVDLSRVLRERDEWRERFQAQEDTSRRLETKLSTICKEHAEQIAKWKERTVFDPNEPKRIALCMTSLQKTLDARLEENEAMVQRLRTAHAQQKTLAEDNHALRDRLAEHVAFVEHHRRHLLRSLVDKQHRSWIHAAWCQWLRRHWQTQLRDDIQARDATTEALAEAERATREAHYARVDMIARWRTLNRCTLESSFQCWRASHHRLCVLRRVLNRCTRRSVWCALQSWRRTQHEDALAAKDASVAELEAALRDAKAQHERAQAELEAATTRIASSEEALDAQAVATDHERHVEAARHQVLTQRLANQRWQALHVRRLQDVLLAWRCRTQQRTSLRTRKTQWQRHQAHYALHMWHARARLRRYCEPLYWHFAMRRHLRHTRLCFGAWKMKAMHAKHRRQRVATLVHRRATAVYLRSSWLHWCAHVAQRCMHRTYLVRLVQRKCVRLVQLAVHRWKMHRAACEKRGDRVRALLLQVLAQEAHVRQYNTYHRWAALTAHRQCVGGFTEQQAQRSARRLAQRMWSAWRQYVGQKERRRDELRRLVAAYRVRRPLYAGWTPDVAQRDEAMASLRATLAVTEADVVAAHAAIATLETEMACIAADGAASASTAATLAQRMSTLENCLMAREEAAQHHLACAMHDHGQMIMCLEDYAMRLWRATDETTQWQAMHALATRAHTSTIEQLETVRDQLVATVARKALQIWLQKSIVFLFNRWKSFVKQRRASADRLRYLLRLCHTNVLQRTFGSWKEFRVRRVQQAAILGRWQSLHAASLLRSTYKAWVSRVLSAKYLGHLMRTLGSAFQHTSLSHLFSVWHTWVAERQCTRRVLDRALQIVVAYRLRKGLAEWSATAERLGAERYATQLALGAATLQKAYTAALQRHWFASWVDHATKLKHDRLLLLRCATRLRHLSVGWTFNAWRDHSLTRIALATFETRRAALQMRQTQQHQRRCFVAWAQHMLDRRMRQRLYAAADGLHLRRTFQRWRRAAYKHGYVRYLVRRVEHRHYRSAWVLWLRGMAARDVAQLQATWGATVATLQAELACVQTSSTAATADLAATHEATCKSLHAALHGRSACLAAYVAKTRHAQHLRRCFRAWSHVVRCDVQATAATVACFQRRQADRIGSIVLQHWRVYTKWRQRCSRLARKFQTRHLARAVAQWHAQTATKLVLVRVMACLGRRGLGLKRLAWRHWLLVVVVRRLAETHATALDRERRLSMDAGASASVAANRDVVAWKRKWAISLVVSRMRWSWHRRQMASFQQWQQTTSKVAWQAQTTRASQLRESAFGVELQAALASAKAAHVQAMEALVGPLRTLWHALFRAKSIEALLDGVVAGVLPHAAGCLWLANPANDELWSKANDAVVAVPSHMGPALGVVQMACDASAPATDMYVLCHAAAFAIECILSDVLKHNKAKGDTRATLTKVFKQHRNWRLYYTDLARRFSTLQADHTALQAAKALRDDDVASLEHRITTAERRHRAAESQLHERIAAKQAQLEETISALEAALIAREDAVVDLRHDVEAKSAKLRQYKAALQSYRARARSETLPKEDSGSAQRAAEISNLRNQLGRAQADAQFLAKAIAHAMLHDGSLPRSMEAEVLRICSAQTA
ncbi:hypothetical protein SPRG_01904 [Saprolegnia parasitica CBS 223.65]|uniref:Uncharacterized protein n=1 Tax=Saprolegnia parasitica (strain CBS 223.65) TaxID=695850 RepID=A0A067D2W9_SAPPC|nr:hypothetical protein SPRG_01904 [Saprolegnia parasitica CBS 223.65]KDO33091.1 hypothetical protein SPRG_01904 [Saprolegnia parasitica CBS 223.65]|eukprot:XP_012195860.1 hypothetical protein SPRG_01904 [Saprolegnia parasitica CBS 223.65]